MYIFDRSSFYFLLKSTCDICNQPAHYYVYVYMYTCLCGYVGSAAVKTSGARWDLSCLTGKKPCRSCTMLQRFVLKQPRICPRSFSKIQKMLLHPSAEFSHTYIPARYRRQIGHSEVTGLLALLVQKYNYVPARHRRKIGHSDNVGLTHRGKRDPTPPCHVQAVVQKIESNIYSRR